MNKEPSDGARDYAERYALAAIKADREKRGERVLLWRYKNLLGDQWMEADPDGDCDDDIEYRYATLDKEQA